MKKLNKNNKGFSLVELLVVIAIMVVLVGVIAPTLLGNIEKSRVASDVQSLDAVASALQNALGTEAAYTEAMKTADTEATLKSLYDKAGKAGADKNAFADTVKEYLDKIPEMKGTEARKITLDTNLMYEITSNGQVKVTLYKTVAGTGTTADVLDVKGTAYSVTR